MKKIFLIGLTLLLIACSSKPQITGGSIIVDEDRVAVSADVAAGDKEVTVTVEEKRE